MVPRILTPIEHHAPQPVNPGTCLIVTLIVPGYSLFPQTSAALHDAPADRVMPRFFDGAAAVTLKLPATAILCRT